VELKQLRDDDHYAKVKQKYVYFYHIKCKQLFPLLSVEEKIMQ